MYYRKLGLVALDVVRARDWYKEIGIPTGGTRLEKIHDFIFYRLTNSDSPEAQELEQSPATTDTFYALSDGHAFGLITRALSADRKLRSHLPRRNLKRILEGPLRLSEETAGVAADARNIFLELELAAYMSSAGFRISGFDDLEFEFEGFRYLVECKRPFSERALDRNIEGAYNQLRKKMDGERSRGIVAISVEKVFYLDQKFHHFTSLKDVNSFTLDIAEKFRTRIAKYRSRWIDTRVVGVLAIIRFLTRIDHPESYGPTWTFGLFKFATSDVGQAADDGRLDRIVRMLQADLLNEPNLTQSKPAPAGQL